MVWSEVSLVARLFPDHDPQSYVHSVVQLCADLITMGLLSVVPSRKSDCQCGTCSDSTDDRIHDRHWPLDWRMLDFD